jgi:hypothetical protein
MPSLTKSEYNQAMVALRKHKGKVPLNNFWQALHNDYNIGQPQGKQLILKLEDRDLLKGLLEAQVGSSEFIGKHSISSRIATSEHFIDEKWLTAKPLANIIQVRSINGPLRVDACSVELPLASYLAVDLNRIKGDEYHSTIVVENFEAFLHIDQFILPKSLGHALVLYRGHDQAAKQALNFLTTLTDHAKVIAFTDADPAGISIALSMPNINHWLIAEDISGLQQQLKKANKLNQQRFAKQAAKYLSQLTNLPKLAKSATAYINTIMVERIAIAQEKLLQRRHPIKVISIAKKLE